MERAVTKAFSEAFVEASFNPHSDADKKHPLLESLARQFDIEDIRTMLDDHFDLDYLDNDYAPDWELHYPDLAGYVVKGQDADALSRTVVDFGRVVARERSRLVTPAVLISGG